MSESTPTSFKFEVGQRVVLRRDQAYLEAGTTGTITQRTLFFGAPEYLVITDEVEYSNVAGWYLKEEHLVAEDA